MHLIDGGDVKVVFQQEVGPEQGDGGGQGSEEGVTGVDGLVHLFEIVCVCA